MNGEDRTLCVTVDGTKRVVSGVNWKTTARDVIQKLRPRSGPQILLESWRGCVRPVHEDEYICQLLEEWGAEAERVQLVILSSHSLPGYRLAKPGLNTAQIYRAQRHGKVSSNKKRCLSRLTTPKKKIAEEIERLIAKAQAAQERLSAVKELQHTQTDITPPQSPSLHLSPSEDEEWVALQEQLAEEEQEHKALQERRREISEKIDKQNDEIMRVKNENTALQTKLSVEQEKQKEVLSAGDRSKELEEAQLQVEQLQNELKVRMKLNQLQSTKIQEMSKLISTAEQERGNFQAEIEVLKSTK